MKKSNQVYGIDVDGGKPVPQTANIVEETDKLVILDNPITMPNGHVTRVLFKANHTVIPRTIKQAQKALITHRKEWIRYLKAMIKDGEKMIQKIEKMKT